MHTWKGTLAASPYNIPVFECLSSAAADINSYWAIGGASGMKTKKSPALTIRVSSLSGNQA